MIKTVWYWHKNRNIDQWNKIESPAINPRIYGHLILTEEARKYNGEKTASSISGAGTKWTAICKRTKLEHFPTPHTKINSKWIKDLNYKTPRGKHRQNILQHKPQQDPL